MEEYKVKKIKELRNKGYTYKEIADKLGVSITTICYHLNKQKVYNRIREWSIKNKDKILQRRREWRKKHPYEYRKKVAFSLLRNLIKNNKITKEEILALFNEQK